MSMGRYPGQEPHHYSQQSQPGQAVQQTEQSLRPRQKNRALPWIIVGAVLVVLAAAAVVLWLVLSQAAARDGATAAHERAVAEYEEAWESLQERIEASALLLAEAESTEAVGGDELDTARDSLAEAEGIERIEPEDPDSLPGAAEIEADTERIRDAEGELSDAEETLAEDFEALHEELIGRIVAGIEAQIDLSQQVASEARDRLQDEAAEGLSALIGEARALIESPDATTDDLYEVWDRLIDETDAVSEGLRPIPEDVEGDWCYASGSMNGRCVSIVGMELTWDSGGVDNLRFTEQKGDCFYFSAQPSDVPVGGYMLLFCPAGAPIASSELSSTDAPDQDRFFTGQAYPLDMALRE